MMGDFDIKQGSSKSTKASSGGNNSKKATSGKAGKCYYNENEYNDQQVITTSIPAPTNGSSGRGLTNKGGGDVICKRGLGYHFSRSRKKSRVVTRSAVMAWQTTLRDAKKARPANSDRILPSCSVDKLSFSSADGRLMVKSQMMLALVSTKCSRVAREEARWRGDVDYRVAYPERHASRTANSSTTASCSSSVLSATTHRSSNCTTTTGGNTNRLAKNGNKRPNVMMMMAILPGNKSGDVDVPMNSCHKRQRTTSDQVSMDGCSLNSPNNSADGGIIDRDELSPNTIGLLSGVLHAEV